MIIYDVQNRGDPSIIQVVIHVYLVFVVGAILLSPATVLNTIADGVDFHVQHVREVSHELYVEAWFSTHTKTVVSRPIDDFLVVRMVFSMSQVPAGGEGWGGRRRTPHNHCVRSQATTLWQAWGGEGVGDYLTAISCPALDVNT